MPAPSPALLAARATETRECTERDHAERAKLRNRRWRKHGRTARPQADDTGPCDCRG